MNKRQQDAISRSIHAPHINRGVYLFTLDSHDCYGPLRNKATAHQFAANRGFSSYQILYSPPSAFTLILEPTYV